jgi:hypothetical protein
MLFDELGSFGESLVINNMRNYMCEDMIDKNKVLSNLLLSLFSLLPHTSVNIHTENPTLVETVILF